MVSFPAEDMSQIKFLLHEHTNQCVVKTLLDFPQHFCLDTSNEIITLDEVPIERNWKHESDRNLRRYSHVKLVYIYMIDYEKSRSMLIPTGKTEEFYIGLRNFRTRVKNAYKLYMR